MIRPKVVDMGDLSLEALKFSNCIEGALLTGECLKSAVRLSPASSGTTLVSVVF